MKDSKKGITFPYLIHRNDAEIENEISQKREQNAQVCKHLTELYNEICKWCGREMSLTSFFDYLLEGEHEMELLETYRQVNNLPKQVKAEKISEVFRVPDYSGILQRSINLQKSSGIEAFYSDNGIRSPQISEKEKNAIVQKHSFFVYDKESLLIFTATKHICTALNILNLDLHDTLSQNKTGVGQIKQALPDIAKFIVANPVLDGSNKREFSVNFAAFSK